MIKALYTIIALLLIMSLSYFFSNEKKVDLQSNISKKQNNTKNRSFTQIDDKNKPLFKHRKAKKQIKTNSNKQQYISDTQLKKELDFQNERKMNYEIKQYKTNRYLTYQAKLNHIKKGGVKSKLESIKTTKEQEYQRRYNNKFTNKRKYQHDVRIERSKMVHHRVQQMRYIQNKQQINKQYKGE